MLISEQKINKQVQKGEFEGWVDSLNSTYLHEYIEEKKVMHMKKSQQLRNLCHHIYLNVGLETLLG